MAKTLSQVSIRTSNEIKEWFRESFEGSGTSSQGEFLSLLLNKYNNESEPQKEKVFVTVEKQLSPDQIILSLSPVQMFALRQNVLSSPDFAQRQNEIIDSLKSSSPFMYFGKLYDPEIQQIWIRNVELKKEMSPEEREQAIRHNMTAFIVNMFLMHAVEGNLSATNVNAEAIKSFIHKRAIAQKENINDHENGKNSVL